MTFNPQTSNNISVNLPATTGPLFLKITAVNRSGPYIRQRMAFSTSLKVFEWEGGGGETYVNFTLREFVDSQLTDSGVPKTTLNRPNSRLQLNVFYSKWPNHTYHTKRCIKMPNNSLPKEQLSMQLH